VVKNGWVNPTIASEVTLSASRLIGFQFRAKLNIIDCPVTGSPRPAATKAIRRIDAHTFELVMKSEGNRIRQARWTVNADGNDHAPCR
jgi:hypothetical protein